MNISDENRLILLEMEYMVLQCRPSLDPSSSRSVRSFLRQYLLDEQRKRSYNDLSSQLAHEFHALPYIINHRAYFEEISYKIFTSIIHSQDIQGYLTIMNLGEIFSVIRMRENWSDNVILNEVIRFSDEWRISLMS